MSDFISALELAERDPKFRRKLQREYRRNFTHRCPLCGRPTRASICFVCRKKAKLILLRCKKDGV